MPPKRKVATQPTAIPSTRKAPTRGAGAVAKKLAEPESEPETVETTELEDIDDIEDDEDTAPKRRRETGKKHPPPSSSLVSLLQPTQKPAAARTTTTSKSRGRTGKASKANAKDVESGTEDDLGGTIEKAQGVGGEGIGIPEGTRKEKAQPLPKAKPIRKRLTKKERDALANREIAETQFTPVRIGTEKEVEVVEVEDQEEEEEETSRKGGEDDAVSPQALPKSTSRKREASPARQPSAKRPNPHGKSSVDGAQGNGSLVEALLRKQAEEMTRRFHETDTRLKELTKLKLTDAEAALAKYKEVMEARIASIPPFVFRFWCYRGLILTIHLLQQPLKISIKPCNPMLMPSALFRSRTSLYRRSSYPKTTNSTPSMPASTSSRSPSKPHNRRSRLSRLN